MVVNIGTDQTIAFVQFEDAVQEVFSVEVLHGTRFPDITNHDQQLIWRSYVHADSDFANVPEQLRGQERLAG